MTGPQFPSQPNPSQPNPGQQYPGQQYPGQQNPGQQFGAPQFANPQYGAPQYGQPQYGQPQYGGQPQYPGQAPAPKSNTNKIIFAVLGVLVVIGAVVGILFATGVFGGSGSGGNDEEQVRALYEGMETDFKNGDIDSMLGRMCEHPSADQIKEELDSLDLGDALNSMSMKVDSVEINGDRATIDATISVMGMTDTETATARKVDGKWCLEEMP